MLKKYPLVLIALRYGLIAGVLGFALLLGLYWMGRHPFLIPVFFDFRVILFAVLIFFSIREFRDFNQRGILSFAQGMLMSSIFTAMFAVVSSLLIWCFTEWKPDFVSSYISLTQEQMKSIPPDIIERIGKDTFEHNVKMLPGTRGIDLALLYFGQSFVISFFISIIISVILRRQPKPS